MPKKKLTKTQVKRKLKTIANALYDMLIDRWGHGDSFVPMSYNKIVEIHKAIMSAGKRVK